MAKAYDAIRVEEETKERLNDVIPDGMTRDDFVNELLDQYEDSDGENTGTGSTSSPGVSNDDLQTQIKSLSEQIDALGGRRSQY